MLAYLSDQWLAALQAAADVDDELRAALVGASLTIEQHVTGGPNGDVVFHVALGDGTARFGAGPIPDPDVTFTQAYEVAAEIGSNDLSAQSAFMVGRLCVEGRIERLHEEAASLSKVGDVFQSVRARTTY